MNTTAHFSENSDTICALATPPGVGAISVIRISGAESFAVCAKIFQAAKKDFDLQTAATHTLHFGTISNEEGLLDEVLISVFRAPNSYTGEDSIEISTHGSLYIQQKVIELLLSHGIRLAKPGEYTMRAFMNGKFDLSQAEAVADLIAAQSSTAHDMALDQMRGGFSSKIKDLRRQLVDFASLIELELDFAEEDVEFANRGKLFELLETLLAELNSLIDSFAVGNVLKHGIPVAIVGKPNVGKSTLLNALLNEERAIVSEIPGTTRDVIEDSIVIDGHSFRFIDTAGIREATDEIETIGIERTYEQLRKARIVLYMCDLSFSTPEDIQEAIADYKTHARDTSQKWILIGNKIDKLMENPREFKEMVELDTVFVSAKRKENIQLLAGKLVEAVGSEEYSDQAIVSNIRHYEALTEARKAIQNVEHGLRSNIPTDLLTIDIRQSLHHLGSITGQVTTDEILGNIFNRFCIGK